MRRMRLLYLLSFIFMLPIIGSSQVYVAISGSDQNDGSKEKPFQSVAMALRKVRELRRLNDASIKHGIDIIVGGGTYSFSEPLFIRPEDSGTETSPTSIVAAKATNPVFSGGYEIKGWQKVVNKVPGLPGKANGKLWVAKATGVGEEVLDFRELWVNNKKAIRARERNADSMYRILSWNHKTEQCWIPKPSVNIAGVTGMEMFIHQWWAIAILRIKSIAMHGDSALLSFYQPESRIESEHPWPSPWISSETGNSAFYLANAIQFLDEPGEWYLDKKAGKIYYWPLDDENMNAAKVVVPSLEELVQITGERDHPVTNIHIKGISFQYTSWMRPSHFGHVPLQTGMFLLDAYKLKVPGTPDKKTLENQAWVGRPAAAFTVNYASNCSIEDCRFEHIGSTALDFYKGVQSSSIIGNSFRDIGGTAILAGIFSDEATEAHLPYNPSDNKDVCNDIEINNNLVNDAANEDWGCVGIAAGFVSNTSIQHNDISEVPYTGISLGWGWTKSPNVMHDNKIRGNRIVRYGRQLYDVSGIYTLSAQPGTVIAENYIDSIYKAPYAHLPYHWFYLYTDEGSSGITVKNNWTPTQKYLQNANGPGNLWENNGPMVATRIKDNAGLQPAFKYLLTKGKFVSSGYKTNHELPSLIEIITPGTYLDIKKLKSVLAENNVSSTSLYQWHNHYVIFDKIKDPSQLRSKMAKAFPGIQTKAYYDPFYEFNRSHCPDTTSAREWDHIILTANLVADPRLQEQYMNYHAHQFENWPEVSKGFCNADFQQLLVYRSGRQLMLIISIPKGESLDKLNPKTTENNPRVDDWNRIMKRYQQGIEGTQKGEVWVFLQRLE
jgi:hypothetical protein